ncbi:hypothetical protein OJF2_05650 [Aquisphaera giovannonii]|uniref:Uncharacterized protein n=1 Tax=Aquisphaera giovannonii TaxID=406548 RepID=A0A5B9VU66_9BACT|nr:hypothetical protein OJF2_05650 [Aquisphaera giovannonii]
MEMPANLQSLVTSLGPLKLTDTQRTVVTLGRLVRSRLSVHSYLRPECHRHKTYLRPVREGRFATPHHRFGLHVIAAAVRFRRAEHHSVPEVHAELACRSLPI